MTSKHKNPQYNLRMPDELKERLRESAEERGVSLNAEIISRLEQSFHQSGLSIAQEDLEMMAEIVAKKIARRGELDDE